VKVTLAFPPGWGIKWDPAAVLPIRVNSKLRVLPSRRYRVIPSIRLFEVVE